MPGFKGEFSGYNKHCKEKITKFGGELIYSVIINLDNNNIYTTFHCIWKYNNKLYDITQSDIRYEHNKNSIFFIPANNSKYFIIRKVDN